MKTLFRSALAVPVLGLLSVSVASLMSGKAEAQGVLEEVVVTARKREENLQETPVAVSAFDSRALEKAGIRNLADFNKAIPGLDVNTTNGTAPNANIFIRGVGQRNVGANIDSGVGVYLDGVYLARSDGALLDITDIQSVQVLRGPQGTLFGKNTTGGAVVFTTNRPAPEFESNVSVGTGSYNEEILSGMVNVPFTDRLATRLAFISKQRDGYVDNTFLGTESLDEDRLATLFKLRYEASENLVVDVVADYSKVTSSPRVAKCKVVPSITGWLAELLDEIVITPSTGRKFIDFCQDSWEAGGGDMLSAHSDIEANYLAEVKGISLQFDWLLTESLSLKSITAYRNTIAAQDDDLEGTAIAFNRMQHGNPFLEPRDTDQFSQEFQLTGDWFNGAVDYVGGLYYFQEETTGSIHSTAAASPMGPTVAGPDTFLVQIFATETLPKHWAAAAYAQFDWEFSPRWTLTAGLRYTTENRELDLNTYVPDPSTLNRAEGGMQPVSLGNGIYRKPLVGPYEYNSNFAYQPVARFSEDLSNSAWTPMASLRYLFEDWGFVNGGSAYLTVSEGFLSGGINESTSSLDTFEAEEVLNFEVGVKLDMWDRRLRVNTSVFNTIYDNRQLTTLIIDPNTQAPVGANLNAEATTIKGIELEASWFATENLLVQFNGSVNQGDIQEFSDTRIVYVEDASQPTPSNCSRTNLVFVQVDECEVDRSDEDLPRLAERMAYLALQYNIHTDIGTFVPRIEGSFKYDVEYCFDRGSCLSEEFRSDVQRLFAANLSWHSPNEDMRVSVFGSNLTNEDFIVGGVALTDALGSGSQNAVAPRMWGMEISYQW